MLFQKGNHHKVPMKCFKMRPHTQVNKSKTRAGGRQSTKVLLGWPVPYTMKPEVEVEEKRLEEEKILHKVKFSNWSIPIVPVIKPNGPVLTCGDYKITVNPQRQPKKYPPPSHRWHICWAGEGGRWGRSSPRLTSDRHIIRWRWRRVTRVLKGALSRYLATL